MKMTLPVGMVLFAALAGPALALDYPAIKEGLWSSTATIPNSKVPPQSGTMCNSTEVMKSVIEARKGPNQVCKTISLDHSGSTYTHVLECNFGGRVTKMTNVTTFTGDTAIHSESRKDDGAVGMISDSKYLGACPAGMAPGDFVGANGMKFNILHPENMPMPPGKP